MQWMGLDIKRPDCVAISISNLNLIAIIFISPSFIRVFFLTGTSMVHLMCKCPCKYDEIIVLTFPQSVITMLDVVAFNLWRL